MIMKNTNETKSNNYTQILRKNVDDTILGENTFEVGEKSWIFPLNSADDKNFVDATFKGIKRLSETKAILIYTVKNKNSGTKAFHIPVTTGCVIEMSIIEACDCMLGLSILEAQVQVNEISKKSVALQVVGVRKYWEEEILDENSIIYEPDFSDVDKSLYDTETYYTGDKLPYVPTSLCSAETCYLKCVGRISTDLYKMTLQIIPEEGYPFEIDYYVDNTSEIRLNYFSITGGSTFTGTSLNTCKVRITNLQNNQVGLTIIAIDYRNLEN